MASANSAEPLNFKFENTGTSEFYVYWIDQSGREADGQGGQMPLLTVAPGTSGVIQTSVGHYFSVFDGQQTCLGVFMAAGTEMAVTLPIGGGSATGQTQPDVVAGEADAEAGTDATPASQGGDLSRIALDKHNQLRSRHCVPLLAWSERLATTAQQWANACDFRHSGNGLGENLAMGTSGAYPPDAQIQSWYDEVGQYDFASGGFSSGTGHFTQVIWRSTTEVGCGVATCGGEDMLVCNYSPPGNYQGEYQQNVPAACQ